MSDDPLNAQPDEKNEEFNNNRWLGEIGADIRSLASSIRHTASGVASFVHRSALTVAEEIARLEEEEEEEIERKHAKTEAKDSVDEQNKESIALRLPWELVQPHQNHDHDSDSCMKSTFIEDTELKRRILLLSHDEASFLQPHRQVLDEDAALDASRIDLIQRILKVDDYLAVAHKNLQNTISEATFWCNYFESCSAVRQKYLQEQLGTPLADEDDQNEEEDDSFVCVDNSVKSYRSAGMKSVDSLVLVESRFTNSMNL